MGFVLNLSGICSGSAWALCGISISPFMGFVLDLHGVCIAPPMGFALDFYCGCRGFLRDLYWTCMGSVVNLHGACVGLVLPPLWDLYWISIVAVRDS